MQFDERYVITDEEFHAVWNAMSHAVNATARDKGWWERDEPNAVKIALMHSELSEALEADRTGGNDDKLPEFSGLEVELADAIIRIMDFGAQRGLRIAEAVTAKAAYNKGRSYRHGGKRY